MTDINQSLVISDIHEDKQVLRDRFQRDGYLFIKRYIESPLCEQLMHQFLDILDPHISFDTNEKKPVLTGEPFFETDNTWDKVYPKMQSLEQFHNFFHQPSIIDLMKTVTGTDIFVYPMKMARISTPKKVGYETPPHQDAHSHHAGPTMAGIWVALHDINGSMGRLKLLPGSHKHGVRKVFPAEGVGGVQCEIFPNENTWHVSDVEQGDVIIFHSATVHKAEPNTADTLARLSIDTRFCDYGAPVFSTNIEPHHGWRIEGFGWDTIYKNWKNQDNQYYWRDYPGLF